MTHCNVPDPFSWSVDEEFQVSPSMQVRVLQREVPDPSVWEVDLRPFKDAPALWVYERGRELAERRGVLTSLTLQDESDTYEVVDANSQQSQFVVSKVRQRQLTVWRVDGQLDMLQIRALGKDAKVYGQLGGAATLPTLSEAEVLAADDEVVATIRTLYATGRLSRR